MEKPLRIFNIAPFSGHIMTAIKDAVEIARAFPQHTFFLTFNTKTLKVTDEETMREEYFRDK